MRIFAGAIVSAWLVCALLGGEALGAPPAAPAFADFESVGYVGWTLTGNCWGAETTSGRVFGGQVVGYAGDRYACTLDPVIGARGTGTAVSQEFTIAQPYITFLIGGGDYPGRACLNLVVDGAIVATATGDDMPSFEPHEWDVTAQIGKRARLEIVDSTHAARRGYVMVDEIRFSPTSMFAPAPAPAPAPPPPPIFIAPRSAPLVRPSRSVAPFKPLFVKSGAVYRRLKDIKKPAVKVPYAPPLPTVPVLPPLRP